MKKTGEGDQFQHAVHLGRAATEKFLFRLHVLCRLWRTGNDNISENKKRNDRFVQGHLHTEEGRDANNQKVYFVTVTVDYQQIIEKQEFNGLELCTGLPQFPVLKQEEKGGK